MKANFFGLVIFLLLITLFSCKKDPTFIEITSEFVEIDLSTFDCWTEKEDESILQFAGSNHTFCFLNDEEFTLILDSWTDVISPSSPSHWTEYIKGTYVWTNESFEITGKYMDADFINFETSLSGATDFSKLFTVKVVTETEMILDHNNDFPYLGIRLLK